MQTLKKYSTKLTTQLMAAGFYFVAVLSPSATKAQGLREAFEGGEDIQPEGVVGNLLGDGGVFQRVANILLIIIGAVAVIMLIVGGFRYVASGGDSNAVEGAKNTILYAVIGIVVAFLAYAAINFLTGQLQS